MVEEVIIEDMKEEDENDISTDLNSLVENSHNIVDWSDEIENVLKIFGERAAGYRELCNNNATYWKSISNKLSVPIIFLTAISSITTFNAVNYDDYQYWMYAAGSVNFIAAFLTSLNKYMKPEEKAQQNIMSSKAFGSYYRKILFELSLCRHERETPNTFIKWSKEEYDKLMFNIPTIQQKIIKNFKQNHPFDINIPDIVSDNYKITINRT